MFSQYLGDEKWQVGEHVFTENELLDIELFISEKIKNSFFNKKVFLLEEKVNELEFSNSNLEEEIDNYLEEIAILEQKGSQS